MENVFEEVREVGDKLNEKDKKQIEQIILTIYEMIRIKITEELHESLPDFKDLTEREKGLIFNMFKLNLRGSRTIMKTMFSICSN